MSPTRLSRLTLLLVTTFLIALASSSRLTAETQRPNVIYMMADELAVRMDHWKAVRPNQNGPWELYDLSRDLAEQDDVAADHPDVLAKMTAFAEQAHTPAEEGVFHNRELHERDRQAKYGDTRATKPPEKFNPWPTSGLVPSKECKLVRVSSESTFNNRDAKHALDGDPRTAWHTQFQKKVG